MLRLRLMSVRRACNALVLLLIAAATGLYPAPVHAQSVVDPNQLQFTASSDHWGTAPDGVTPVLLRYEVQFFLAGAAQPFQAESIGKPNPDGNGNITFSLASLSSLPSPGLVAEARLAAVGPGGSTLSAASNTFAFSQPAVPPPPAACTYPLSPATQSLPAAGGSAGIIVNAGGGCTWTASSDSGWLTIAANGAGAGYGVITVSAGANATGSPRTATLTVEGQSVTVTQPAAAVPPPAPTACSYPLSPTTQQVAASGATISVMVNAGNGCTWSATSDAAWLPITANATATGFQYVILTAAANTTGSARTATVTVQGQTATVTQPAAAVPPPTTCSYPLSPATQSVAAGGGSATVMVNAGGGCAWTASSDSGWLRIISGGGGNGFGYIVMTADPNTQGSTRTAVISVAGQWVTVTQASTTAPPTTCSVTVNPTSLSLDKVGTSASLAVSAAANCAWNATSTSSWLVITAQTGAGNGWISYRVSANSGGARVGTINVGGVTVVVSQAGPANSTPPPAPSGLRILK